MASRPPSASSRAEVPEHRARLEAAATQIVSLFRDDPVVRAIAAAGSYANGNCDEHSDLDLHFIVHQEGAREFLQRFRDRFCNYAPVAVQAMTSSAFSARSLILVYESGLRVDAHINVLERLRIDTVPMVLLDREGILADFKPVAATLDGAELVRHVEYFLLGLSDVLKFLRRNEPIHATWRTCQLMQVVGTFHRALLDPQMAELGIKHLDLTLPDPLRTRYFRAFGLIQPATLVAGLLEIADLAEEALRGLEPQLESKVNWSFFHRMKSQIAECETSGASAGMLTALPVG